MCTRKWLVSCINVKKSLNFLHLDHTTQGSDKICPLFNARNHEVTGLCGDSFAAESN